MPYINSWSITEFNKKDLKIVVEFAHPLYVSSEGPDLLKIIVEENAFFISAEHDVSIKNKFKVEVKVPTQARSEEDADFI
jgi:hypothetical protein